MARLEARYAFSGQLSSRNGATSASATDEKTWGSHEQQSDIVKVTVKEMSSRQLKTEKGHCSRPLTKKISRELRMGNTVSRIDQTTSKAGRADHPGRIGSL